MNIETRIIMQAIAAKIPPDQLLRRRGEARKVKGLAAKLRRTEVKNE